jgi:ferredoxin--NADP+ reductase
LAPFISYLRTLHRDQGNGKFPEGHKLFLINGASRSWEFGYHGEIEQIATQSPWLKYVPTVSRPWEDDKWQGEVGRVDDLVRKYLDMWGLTPQNTNAYVCGHPEMIEHAKGILRRRGFSKEALKEEIYWIPAKKPVAQ